MSTRLDLINKINRILSDSPTTRSFYSQGENGRTLFNFKSKPVVPGSEAILIGGAPQTNGTDYIIDYENGSLNFFIPPNESAQITGSYQYSEYSAQAKIDALNNVLTGGFLQQEVYDTDAIDVVHGHHSYDLPANIFSNQLLEVWLHGYDGRKEKRLRRYVVERGAGTGGVDKISFQNTVHHGRIISLRYIKVFNSLDSDTALTDLPASAEMAACLKAAADVIMYQEPERLLSAKKLGYKGDSDGAKEGSFVSLSQALEQKAIRERNRAGLDPSYVSTMPIINY